MVWLRQSRVCGRLRSPLDCPSSKRRIGGDTSSRGICTGRARRFTMPKARVSLPASDPRGQVGFLSAVLILAWASGENRWAFAGRACSVAVFAYLACERASQRMHGVNLKIMKSYRVCSVGGWALWTLAGWWAAHLCAAEAPQPESPKAAGLASSLDPVKDLITFSSKYTNVSPLPVGAYDGNVASLTAKLLKRYHYDRRGLDSALSERFLERYFNLLDPMRIHFLKSDIAEFGRLRDRLPELTLERGDSSKANEIFARFLQRVDQRVEYVAGLLVENQFDFTGSDRHTPNRKDADWPDTLDSARELWRQHLRYEYLQEKLNKHKPE